ncbi:MAG TPA: alkaline phosphatase family protein, partial [Candidatus Obscuribacterales bacterium]
MLFRRAAAFLLLLLVCFAGAAPAKAQGTARTKLVLMLVIDQFSYDYLGRFNDHLGSKGFRYLLEHGAAFTNCRYRQATTETAIGHSIIASGAYPWATGIVGNEWFDRRRDADTPAVFDDSVQMVGGNGQGASCKSMLGTTFGDQLKLLTNGRSRVIALSMKDRGALFLAGKLGNGAYWFDARTGNFVSSSQFGTSLPAWVKTFNDQHYPDRFFGKAWQRLLPETAYTASTRDDFPYEASPPGDGRQFPHVLTGGMTAPSEPFYTSFEATPFANDLLADLARVAFEQEALGQHGDPDMLCISFSATDHVGHAFGPNSQEAEDTFLRLDQTLGKLLQIIDQKVGLNNCLVVVSGDHGVSPIPELLKEHGQAQGIDAGRIDPKAFRTLLNSAMSSRLGHGDWIAAFDPPNLYLNFNEIDKQKYRQPEVEALAAKLAHGIAGVAEVYTAAQFYADQLPSSPWAPAAKRSYYWGRSGELYVVAKPNYIWSGLSFGTSHGSPYAYDQQVPLMLMGAGVAAGRYAAECSPADIAPTVCALLNMQMPPLCEGRVLHEALNPSAMPITGAFLPQS